MSRGAVWIRRGCPSVGDPDLMRRACRALRAWPITGSGSCRVDDREASKEAGSQCRMKTVDASSRGGWNNSASRSRRHRQSPRDPGARHVAEREELTETGLGSTARWCGLRRHRQANSVRVCSATSRRVASLRPRSAGLTALTSAPRTLVQTGSCRRCPLIHPLHVVVAVLSRMTPFPATVDRHSVRLLCRCRAPFLRSPRAASGLFSGSRVCRKERPV